MYAVFEHAQEMTQLQPAITAIPIIAKSFFMTIIIPYIVYVLHIYVNLYNISALYHRALILLVWHSYEKSYALSLITSRSRGNEEYSNSLTSTREWPRLASDLLDRDLLTTATPSVFSC